MRICELVFRPSAPRAPLTRVRKLVALGALVARDFGPLLVFYGTYAMFGFVPALLNHPCVDDDGGGPVTNLITGLFFGLSLRAEKTWRRPSAAPHL